MSARVLIVDDIAPNVKLLETKLAAEYFETVSATNGLDAIAICEQGLCDLVLLDAMMPGLDGFETCRRLKTSPKTSHLPIIMVTALDQPSDRAKGLEAGADDFLTKPADDTTLFARVRSLLRLKTVLDELRDRLAHSRHLGIEDPLVAATAETGQDGHILVVDDRVSSYERIVTALDKTHRVEVETDPNLAIARVAEEQPDVVMISLGLQAADGLRLCGQIRSLDRTRHTGIVLVADLEDKPRVLRGLEIGANDFVMRPLDRSELMARIRTQVRRQRFADRLRASLESSMELAVTDGLTGLHNRRYLDLHIPPLFDRSARRNEHLAVLLLDIDRFKSINDTYGHDAGDDVLREFARRVTENTRGADLIARFGGEEIVVVVSGCGIDEARFIGERIREGVMGQPFRMQRSGASLTVTVSIGVATRERHDLDASQILKRADLALYRAKNEGRNRVIAAAA